ncbi:MAG: T9SS type A sorting domain-containing protein [Bacteroidota bacterium]
MRLIIFITIIGIFSHNCFSADRYSILDGMGSPGTWTNGIYWSATSGGASCSCTPVGKDVIFINQSIELNQNFSLQANTGRLEIAEDRSLHTLTFDVSIPSNTSLVVYGTLEVYNLTFSNGSVVYVAPTGQIIVHNNLTNYNNSDDVVIDGTVSVEGTFDNGNGGDIIGSGTISAEDFTGTGTTFGIIPTSSIPDSSTVYTGSLPIELLSFDADYNTEGNVLLEWITAVEVNNDYFIIEKTSDGKNFQTLTVIDGSGTTNYITKYFYVDEKPFDGVTYYRLRQTDFDGKSTLSHLISVRKSSSLENSFNIFPNPVQSGQSSFIQANGFEPNIEILVVVLNILGQEQFSKVLITSDDGMVLEAIDPYNQLSVGTYLIIGSSNDKIYKRKLMVK